MCVCVYVKALNIIGQTSKALVRCHGNPTPAKTVSFSATGQEESGAPKCECLHPLFPTLQWQAARLWLSKARASRFKMNEAGRLGRPIPMDAADALSKALKTARVHLEKGLGFPFPQVRGAKKKRTKERTNQQLRASRDQPSANQAPPPLRNSLQPNPAICVATPD